MLIFHFCVFLKNVSRYHFTAGEYSGPVSIHWSAGVFLCRVGMFSLCLCPGARGSSHSPDTGSELAVG